MALILPDHTNVYFEGHTVDPRGLAVLRRACQMISVWRGKNQPGDAQAFFDLRLRFVGKPALWLTEPLPFYKINDAQSTFHNECLAPRMLGVDGFVMVKSRAPASAERPPGVFFPAMRDEVVLAARGGIIVQ